MTTGGSVNGMWLWIGLLAGFLVTLLGMWRLARHARDVEDDSSYLTEEQSYTPFGQKFLDILRYRKQQ